MSPWIEWSIVALLVAVAVFFLVKLLRKDPCCGCSLAGECQNRKKRNKKVGKCP